MNKKNNWRPEILAPAGEPACLEAAVAGGANAVYFGLRHFNARGRAENFRQHELARYVGYLHHYNVKAYVVFNTLIHDDECVKALAMAEQCYLAGVDALIVQDLGMWSLLHRELPEQPLHASTQMTIFDSSQIRVMAGLGAERVILARELDLKSLQHCMDAANDCGVELEHFVHGALCYAYSGQCFMSNLSGCRSANRGTCAQNCRFDYHMESQARGQAVGQRKDKKESILSMKDFAAIKQVPALCDMGMHSFKIEGRYKNPDYVYVASRAYNRAIDAWAAGQVCDEETIFQDLRSVFTRGFTAGMLEHDYSDNTRLRRYDPQHNKSYDAIIESCDRRAGVVELADLEHCEEGFGFTFLCGMREDGFLIINCEPIGKNRWKAQVRMRSEGPRVHAGTPCSKNRDQKLLQEAKQACAQVRLDAFHQAGFAISGQVRLRLGEKPRFQVNCIDGRRAEVFLDQPCAVAQGEGLSKEDIRKILEAWGNTAFHCASALQIEMDTGLFIPRSQLKKLRRQACEILESSEPQLKNWDHILPQQNRTGKHETEIWVIVRSVEQALAAEAAGVQRIIMDDSRFDGWAKDAQYPKHWKAEWFWRHDTVREPSALLGFGRGICCGNIGVLAQAAKQAAPAMADIQANVLNSATAMQLKNIGVESAIISLECSSRDMLRMLERLGDDRPKMALLAHGRLPSMLTRQEHGLEAGEECALRASKDDGAVEYIMEGRGDGGSLIWEARELCAPEYVARSAGLVDAWCLDLVRCDQETVSELVQAYQALRKDVSRSERIEELTRAYASELFHGHIKRGSRELDNILK